MKRFLIIGLGPIGGTLAAQRVLITTGGMRGGGGRELADSDQGRGLFHPGVATAPELSVSALKRTAFASSRISTVAPATGEA